MDRRVLARQIVDMLRLPPRTPPPNSGKWPQRSWRDRAAVDDLMKLVDEKIKEQTKTGREEGPMRP